HCVTLSSNGRLSSKRSGKKHLLNNKAPVKKSLYGPRRSRPKIQRRPSGNSPQRRCANCLTSGAPFKKLVPVCRVRRKMLCGNVSDLPVITSKKIAERFSHS